MPVRRSTFTSIAVVTLCLMLAGAAGRTASATAATGPAIQGDPLPTYAGASINENVEVQDATPVTEIDISVGSISISLTGSQISSYGNSLYNASTPIDTSGLPEGPAAASIHVTDSAGGTTNLTGSITIDHTPPTLTVSAPTNGAKYGKSTPDITIDAAAQDNSGTSTLNCTLSQVGTVLRNQECGGPNYPLPLDDGENDIAITATDGAGNTTTVDRTVYYDDNGPDVLIGGGLNGEEYGSQVAVPFNAGGEDATFVCSIDGGPSAPCTSPTTFSNLSSGSHSGTVTATDDYGNVSSAEPWRETLLGPVATTISASITTSSLKQGTAASLAITLQHAQQVLAIEEPETVAISEDGSFLGTLLVNTQPSSPYAVPRGSLPITLGPAGTHTVTFSVGGDDYFQSSTGSLSYTSKAPGAALIKSTKVIKGKLVVAVFCPTIAYGCTTALTLGKKTDHLSDYSGGYLTVSFALDKKTLALLKQHKRVSLTLHLKDITSRTAVVHLR